VGEHNIESVGDKLNGQTKLNCWEYTKCEMQPGGEKAKIHGPCPAAVDERVNGFNGGMNAGRACWAIAGTYCGGTPKGIYALKLKDCLACDFHELVIKEENKNYKNVSILFKKIKEDRKKNIVNKPNVFQYAYEKAKKSAKDIDQIDSLYISMLIGYTSFCPNISMLQSSKRLCKDDLVDELWVIDAIAYDKRRRATKIVVKTIFMGITKQIKNYLNPLLTRLTK
jgi:hypothetical protein